MQAIAINVGRGKCGVLLNFHPPSTAAVMEEWSYNSTYRLGHTGPVKGLYYLYPYYIWCVCISNPIISCGRLKVLACRPAV